ncbi:MAG: FG-GAP repeat domain-containing protein, partial [Candidatus Hodarchaeota archaeon]
IFAGTSPPGDGLVVADFNGDGRDGIAIQQAGNQSNTFNIIHYNTETRDWQRDGIGQGHEYALVLLPDDIAVRDVIGADIDGDGKVELITNREMKFDMAKLMVNSNWERFGPEMYEPELINEEMISLVGEEILSITITKLNMKKMRRNDLGKDIIVAIAEGRVKLRKNNNETYTVHRVNCSLQVFDDNQWQPQVLNESGGTHFSLSKFCNNVLVADIDGDGIEELILYYYSSTPEIGVVDFAASFPANEGVGFSIDFQSWDWNPPRIYSGDFDGDGADEICFLWKPDGSNNSEEVRFYKWNSTSRRWDHWITFERKIFGNPSIDLSTGDFDGDGISEFVLLFEKPFGNTYHLYKLHISGTGFVWVGDL